MLQYVQRGIVINERRSRVIALRTGRFWNQRERPHHDDEKNSGDSFSANIGDVRGKVTWPWERGSPKHRLRAHRR